MSDRVWQQVGRVEEFAPGGMRAVVVGQEEICLCEYEGEFYAVSRRCGDQNAPLEQGALDGWILSCPLHHSQFDIRTGKNLCLPIDHYLGTEPPPEPVRRFLKLEERLRKMIQVHDLSTYAVRVQDGAIEINATHCRPR
jgi:nitrite reductase/ring-hydroxylating ferredoxin subunit